MFIIRPMLAATQEVDQLERIPYPVLGTKKVDGIRCLTLDNEAVSRRLKPIRNYHIRSFIEHDLSDYLVGDADGELITFTNGKMDDYNTVQSKVMTYAGYPDFKYLMFDYVTEELDKPYSERIEDLRKLDVPDYVEKLLPEKINDSLELEAFELKCLEDNFEGVCLRTPGSPYKSGRSTLGQYWLVKMKRWKESEAFITGFKEMYSNQNPATLDARGYTERGKSQEGMVPTGMLGALIGIDVEDGREVNCGTGFTRDQRIKIWDNREAYSSSIFTYKFTNYGAKDKPRFGVFKGFRLD